MSSFFILVNILYRNIEANKYILSDGWTKVYFLTVRCCPVLSITLGKLQGQVIQGTSLLCSSLDHVFIQVTFYSRDI